MDHGRSSSRNSCVLYVKRLKGSVATETRRRQTHNCPKTKAPFTRYEKASIHMIENKADQDLGDNCIRIAHFFEDKSFHALIYRCNVASITCLPRPWQPWREA